MSFLRGFSIAMGASICMLVFSFLNNKIIYLFLSKSDNGVYFIFLRFSMLVSLVFGEWFRLSNINIAGGDRSTIPALSANNLWFAFSVCIFLLLAVAGFSPIIDILTTGIPVKYIAASVVVGAAAMLRDSSLSILLVVKRMFRYGFTFVIWGTVALILNIVFLMILKRGLDLAVVAWFIGILAAAFWAYLSLASDSGLRMKPSLAVFSRSRAIGIRTWLAVLGMFVMINVHIFIIGPLVGNAEDGLVMVAVFSVCFRIFQLLQRVSNVGGIILLTHVVQEEKPKGFRMTMCVARNIIFFSVVFGLLVLVFRNDSGFPLSNILFPQYEDVTQAMSLVRLALSGGER